MRRPASQPRAMKPHRQGIRDTVTIVLQDSTSLYARRLTVRLTDGLALPANCHQSSVVSRQSSSQTFPPVLMAHAGSCWPIDGPQRLHSRQHTMQLGEARLPGKQAVSLLPQTLTPLLQVWGSPTFATSATAMANLDRRARTDRRTWYAQPHTVQYRAGL